MYFGHIAQPYVYCMPPCVILGMGQLSFAVWCFSFKSSGLTDCPAGGGTKECNQDSGGGRERRGRGGRGTNGECVKYIHFFSFYVKNTYK